MHARRAKLYAFGALRPGLCAFVCTACVQYGSNVIYSKGITNLHKVEDEIWCANECPSPKVADPHEVSVRLHGDVVVEARSILSIFWNNS